MRYFRIVGMLALIVISLTSTAAIAGSSQNGAHRTWLRPDSQSQANTSAGSSRGAVGKSLALIAVATIAGYFLWRKLHKKGELSLPNRPHVRVLSGTVVGPKARAVVAEVGGRFILLGVTEQSVRRLAWLDTLDEVAREDEAHHSEPHPRGDGPLASVSRGAMVPSATLVVDRTDTRSPRFSDVLRDAVGIKSKPANEPAVVLAQATRDRVTLRAANEDLPDPSEYMNIEGQAAGLVSRLNRKK
jgi:flagellar biogenesis protein FliO